MLVQLITEFHSIDKFRLEVPKNGEVVSLLNNCFQNHMLFDYLFTFKQFSSKNWYNFTILIYLPCIFINILNRFCFILADIQVEVNESQKYMVSHIIVKAIFTT